MSRLKTKYFTADSLRVKSRDMLLDVRGFTDKRGLELSPKRSALLILDMQRYFLEETSHAYVPSASCIVPGLVNLVEVYSRRGLPVLFTRHLNQDADAGMLSVWWQDLITADSPTSEIVPEFDLSQGILIEKNQYDAFHGTRLEEILLEKKVTQVAICGVMTHLCCETTARSAFVRGFEVFFTVDGTATYNEEFHRATLLNLAHGFAVPVVVDEILTAVSKPDAG
jgi:isochorismate hydrolase